MISIVKTAKDIICNLVCVNLVKDDTKHFSSLVILLMLTGIPSWAQTGPGGVGSAAGSTGQPRNVIWFDASSLSLSDGNSVETWTDISGNDNHATQSTSGARPLFRTGQINGHPAVVFDGIDDFMPFDGSVIVNSDYTVITVAQRRSNNNRRIIIGGSGNTGNTNLHLYWNNSVTFHHHHYTDDYSGSLISASGGTDPSSYGIFSAMLSSAASTNQRQLYQNNSIIGSLSDNSKLTSYPDAAIARFTPISTFSPVDVTELIIFSNALNDAQLQIVHQYLEVKYGIAITSDLYSPEATYIYDVVGIGEEANGKHEQASSAGLYLTALSGLTVGDYVFTSHNNAANSSADFTTLDLPGGVEKRFNRIWSVKAVNTPEAILAFSISEAVSDGDYPSNYANYVLLHRAGTTGEFSVVKNANGISDGDRVYFNLNAAELQDGYYTLGTEDEAQSPLEGVPGRTWYTLISGDWTNWEVWTLDPSGALPNNPDQIYPSESPTKEADRIVILTGRTIDVDEDNLSHAAITIDGRLDLKQTTGHSFGEIKGTGRILMAADNFPAGDATHFATAGQGEGTAVFYGGSYSLESTHELFDVRIELDDPANVITLLADYTINGDLLITSGNLRINDNAETDILNLTVYGDVTVQANGQISTGTGDTRTGYVIDRANTGTRNIPATDYHGIFHQFTLHGSFTNRGTVKFTNQSAPNYEEFTTTGGVTVRFTGANNSVANLYGQTDFYNLIVDKGIDKTYSLTLYSDNTSYFTLFGPNVVGRNTPSGYSASNPQVRKALFIKTGTLKLTGNIHIPTLSEGGIDGNGDFAVGQNARLWMDGANVTIYTTASATSNVPHHSVSWVETGGSNQALSLYGEFRITDGFLGTRNSAGFIFWAAANAQVKIEGGEVNTAQVRAGGGAGVASYVQSGGLMEVRGNQTEPGAVSGTYPIFGFDDATGVFNMSGGEILLRDIDGSATNGFYIPSAVGNYNVTGGKITVEVASGTDFEIGSAAPLWDLEIKRLSGAATSTVSLTRNLTVLNDLTINGNTLLDVQDDATSTNYDLFVGRNFDLQSGGQYEARTNTTHFIGTETSNIYARNNATAAPLAFYNLNINKDQNPTPGSSYTVTLGNTGRTTTPTDANNTAMEVEGNMTVTRGEFSTFSYKVSLRGNLQVLNGRIVAGDTNPGRIVLNGSAQQTLTGSALYNPRFGRIELNNTSGALATTNVVMDYLLLTAGVLDIAENRLTVDTNYIDGTGFSATKMVKLSGGHGAKGLKLKVEGSYTNTSNIVFPIGTENGATDYYSRMVIDINATTTLAGYITAIAVNEQHPASQTLDNYSYYWTVELSDDFSTTNNSCDYDFYSDKGYSKTGFINSLIYGPLENTQGSWNGGIGGVTINSTTPMGFDVDFASGDFTAGTWGDMLLSATTYSNGTGGGNWTNAASWTNGVPGNNDVAIIRSGDVITMNQNNRECSDLTIQSGGTLNLAATTGHTLTKVSGGGRIRTSSANIPAGDFENFLYNDTAIFEYYGTTALTMPGNFEVYPNLLITGTGTKTMPNQEILVRKSLTIDGPIVNLSGGNNLYIIDSLIIDNAGDLVFPVNTDPVEVTVFRSIDLSGSNAVNVIRLGTAAGTAAHTLRVWDDIVFNANAIVDLFEGSTKYANLYFEGNANSLVNSPGGGIFDLNRLVVNKANDEAEVEILQDFILSGATDGLSTDKALYLIKGDLTINNSSFFDLTTGGGDFVIPDGSTLQLIGATAYAEGSNTGILLDGSLIAGSGSTWFLNGGTNNYIQYTASGSSQIIIHDATFQVGSQIRRSETTEEGILDFQIANSAANVVLGTDGGNITLSNRGILEILNSDSNFEMVAGSSLTIANAQNGPKIPSVYLDPATSSLGAGSELRFGGLETVSNQTMGLNSSIAIEKLTTDNISSNGPTLKLWTNNLTVNSDVTIASATTLNANGLDVTLKGNWLNSGTYIPAGNTTYFSGTAAQGITGESTFYNLTKDQSNALTLNSNITVGNNLSLLSGSFSDGDNNLTVLGNVQMNITHTYGGTNDGIVMNGTEQQVMQGNGTFGKLTINNSMGVTLPVGNAFTITHALKLVSGVFDIDRNLLTLGVNATIQEGMQFSESNMIQTNISFTDAGVIKYFPQIIPADSYSFTYPIGSEGKYTPVRLSIEAMDSGGAIRVKAANEAHPSVQDNEVCPGVKNTENVLKYHWTLEASAVSNFTADAIMQFYPDDYHIQEAYYTEDDYITARLLFGSTQWNKFPPETFDFVNRRLTFEYTGTDDEGISGDYTAGVEDPDCDGAIPDEVPAYISVTDGLWTESSSWAVYNVVSGSIGAAGVGVPAGGPRGSIAYIAHEITIPQNYIVSYKTVINNSGVLKVGSTFGHRFGVVEGSGTLQLERGNLPAGVYNVFFGPSGGTIEFTGSNSYDVLSEITTVRNLKFTGTGERRLPNLDFLIYGNITIDGDDTTLEVINEHDRTVSIEGDIILTLGSFDAGIGTSKIIMCGSTNQTITGNFTGSNAFWQLEVDNAAGVSLNGSIDIDEKLILTDGRITTSPASMLTVTNASTGAVTGYGASRYVDGPMRKYINSGSSFSFPVGDASRYGLVEMSSTSTSGAQYWEAEYFNQNPHGSYDITSFVAPIRSVSNNEYWRVKGPAGGQAYVKVRWDANSIIPIATDPRSLMRIVEWNGSAWEGAGEDITDNGVNDGTIKTDARVALDEHVFTLGAEDDTPVSVAGFTSGDVTICSDANTDLTIGSASVYYPLTVEIYRNGALYDTETITSSAPFPFTVTLAGTYSIHSITDDDSNPGTPFGDDVVVTVIALPTQYAVDIDDTSICEGSTTSVTLADSQVGYTYALYQDGSATGQTLAGTGDGLSFEVGSGLNAGGSPYLFTVVGYSSDLTSCDISMSGSVSLTLIATSTIELISLSPEPACEGEPIELTLEVITSEPTYTITLRRAGLGNDDIAIDQSDLTLVSGNQYTYSLNAVWEDQSSATPGRADYTFSVISFTAGACSAIVPGNATQTVWKRPETGPQYHIPNNHGM